MRRGSESQEGKIRRRNRELFADLCVRRRGGGGGERMRQGLDCCQRAKEQEVDTERKRGVT